MGKGFHRLSIFGAILLGILAGCAGSTNPGEPVTRIAFGSCLDQRLPQPIWKAIHRYNANAFLFLGDNVYGDVSSGAMTELETAYRKFSANPNLKRLRAQSVVMATWDDHDFGRNDAGGDFPWKTAAEKLFLNAWRVSMEDARRHRPGIYAAREFGPPGQRVQIILLDTRYFRASLKRAGSKQARYVPDADASKTLLGQAQWAWLEEQLRRPAELRLIASSIQVLPTEHRFEKWQNLPAERERLINLIRSTRANGVVLLSGDRHLGAVYVDRDALSYPLYEVTSSSLNRPWRAAKEHDSHQISRVFGDENFGSVDIDWDRRRVTLALRDVDGNAVRKIVLPLEMQRQR